MATREQQQLHLHNMFEDDKFNDALDRALYEQKDSLLTRILRFFHFI